MRLSLINVLRIYDFGRIEGQKSTFRDISLNFNEMLFVAPSPNFALTTCLENFGNPDADRQVLAQLMNGKHKDQV